MPCFAPSFSYCLGPRSCLTSPRFPSSFLPNSLLSVFSALCYISLSFSLVSLFALMLYICLRFRFLLPVFSISLTSLCYPLFSLFPLPPISPPLFQSSSPSLSPSFVLPFLSLSSLNRQQPRCYDCSFLASGAAYSGVFGSRLPRSPPHALRPSFFVSRTRYGVFFPGRLSVRVVAVIAPSCGCPIPHAPLFARLTFFFFFCRRHSFCLFVF